MRNYNDLSEAEKAGLRLYSDLSEAEKEKFWILRLAQTVEDLATTRLGALFPPDIPQRAKAVLDACRPAELVAHILDCLDADSGLAVLVKDWVLTNNPVLSGWFDNDLVFYYDENAKAGQGIAGGQWPGVWLRHRLSDDDSA